MQLSSEQPIGTILKHSRGLVHEFEGKKPPLGHEPGNTTLTFTPFPHAILAEDVRKTDAYEILVWYSIRL